MLSTSTAIKPCNNQYGIICMLAAVLQGFVLVEMIELEEIIQNIETKVWKCSYQTCMDPKVLGRVLWNHQCNVFCGSGGAYAMVIIRCISAWSNKFISESLHYKLVGFERRGCLPVNKTLTKDTSLLCYGKSRIFRDCPPKKNSRISRFSETTWVYAEVTKPSSSRSNYRSRGGSQSTKHGTLTQEAAVRCPFACDGQHRVLLTVTTIVPEPLQKCLYGNGGHGHVGSGRWRQMMLSCLGCRWQHASMCCSGGYWNVLDLALKHRQPLKQHNDATNGSTVFPLLISTF